MNFGKIIIKNGFEYCINKYLYPEKISNKLKLKRGLRKIIGHKNYFRIKKLYKDIKSK